MGVSAPSLSVVIPAFNEDGRLGPTVVATRDYLEKTDPDHEIIVVDDGSSDGTARLAGDMAREDPRIQLIRQPSNLGKGAAVRAGVLAARGRQILFADADLATPIEMLERLRSALADGYDIAIASRSLPESEVQVRQHRLRQSMGRGFNWLVQVFGCSEFIDTQCGFKLFSREAAKDLFSRVTIDRFAFDVEVLVLARGRYRVAEVPVVWRHVEESRVSPGIDAAKMFVDLLRIRWRHRSVERPR